jgi:cell division protein FtsN
MMTNKNQEGFLLIGLLIVVAIIVILYTISMRKQYPSPAAENSTSTPPGTTVNVVGAGQQGAASLRDSNQKMLEEQRQLQGQ